MSDQHNTIPTDQMAAGAPTAPASPEGNFTVKEQANDTDEGGSVRILGRFLANMPLLLALAVPAVTLSVFATSGMQGFTWLTGTIANCEGASPCLAQIPYLERTFTVTLTLLGLYALIVTLLRVCGWVLFEVGGQIAAISLFSKLTEALARTRTTFFDEHPSGRIINRVVRDFEQLRFMGPIRIGDSLNAIIELAVFSVVIGLAHPLAGLAVVPSFLVFLYIQRQISPMLQFCIVRRSIRFGEVLHRETDAIEGIRTFLLYGHAPALFNRLRESMLAFTQMHLLRARIEAWGKFWSSSASAVCSSIALLAVAIALHEQTISPAVAAIVVTVALRLAATFGWLLWTLGYLFETAGHARRIFEYIDLPVEEEEEGATPREISQDTVSGSASNEAPKGTLTFRDYTMSYRKDTPPILSGLNLTIPQGSHVGIVGRTGAGKSSLVQALFRMVYVHRGDITIDNVSLLSMPLSKARQSCAVMPQDPYLFAGTLRDNLDPNHAHSDQKLIEMLELAQLSFPLHTKVLEGGANFSVGQRQLIGLARVLLSTAPIVVMDEPTSSVDAITDATVQRILREHLRSRTVLTIAHRLDTLRSSDFIIELDNGAVRRQGTPTEILPTVEQEMNALGLQE